ncbi:unnamed protein product [Ectocarpus sp. 6 AP-2014]
MSSSAPASPCGNHNGQQQGRVVHGGLSESDSDDDNSLGSVPRSSNAGSPPGGGTTPKLRRKPSKRNLFRRRKSKVDPLGSSGSKGNAAAAAAANGSSPADGNRPAASLHVPARRGLFRRRRSNGHHHNGDGAGGQPRPLLRTSSGGGGGGVGLSLSDTESRPRATIAVCGGGGITSNSAHSGVRARGSPEGGGLLSKSDLSRTGGGGGGGHSRAEVAAGSRRLRLCTRLRNRCTVSGPAGTMGWGCRRTLTFSRRFLSLRTGARRSLAREGRFGSATSSACGATATTPTRRAMWGTSEGRLESETRSGRASSLSSLRCPRALTRTVACTGGSALLSSATAGTCG